MVSLLARLPYAPPRFRALNRCWLRVDLGSGHAVGRAASPASDACAPDVLDAACLAAAQEGSRISIPAPPRLEEALSLTSAALSRTGLPTLALELQVPVHAAAAAGMEALLALSALRDRGVGVALSGAAAGAAPLLARLPLSALVLAPGLTGCLPASALDVRTLVRAAHALDLVVIATGIETERQRAALAGLGCDHGEGELFGELA